MRYFAVPVVLPCRAAAPHTVSRGVLDCGTCGVVVVEVVAAWGAKGSLHLRCKSCVCVSMNFLADRLYPALCRVVLVLAVKGCEMVLGPH